MMRGLSPNQNNLDCKECKEMSLKHNQSILEENVQLRKDKEMLEKKLNELLILVDDKMSQMVSALNEIKNKEVTVNQIVSEKTEIKKIAKDEKTRIFIPTPDPSNLKSNIADLQKTLRKTDLNSSVMELTKLQDKSGK